MRSKEVEEAINQLIVDINFSEAGCSTGIIDVKNIETVLSYISELEEKIERFNNELDLDYVDNNFVSKDKVRDKLIELAKKLNEPNDDRWEKDDNAYYENIKAQIRILKEIIGE